MKKSKGLSLQIAGSIALAVLFGTSAFAESRHPGGTRGGGSSRGGGFSRGGGSSRQSFGRGSVSAPRFQSRSFSGSSSPRFQSRTFSGSSSRFGSRGGSSPRFESRGSSAPRFGSRGSSAPRVAPRVSPNYYGRSAPYRGGSYYNNGSRFYGRGRIDRVVPYRGGYNVFLGGWGYPFFVPYRFWDPFRFRIGLFVGFNAFYDPLGYYNVYGWPGYYPPPAYVGAYRDGYSRDDSYRDGDRNTDAVLRGNVESIDLHSGHVVVYDDASRKAVTVLLPPGDRRVDDIRVGDYVEFSGSWVRGQGYDFDADRLDRFDPRR